MSSNNSKDLQRSIIPSEVEKFGKLFMEIKDDDVTDHVLYQFNTIRVPFITEGLIGKRESNSTNDLKEFTILDIGCGGAILTIELAKLGATVIGLEPSSDAVEVAKRLVNSKKNQNIAHRVTFVVGTIEEYSINNKNKFDAIVISEVLEHVSEPQSFLKVCLSTVKPGGSIFITTFEKTFLSWITAIILMEYVFKILPRGLHDWNVFVPISDVEETFAENKCSIISTQGFWYNLWTKTFQKLRSTKITWYALHAVKRL